MNKSAQYRAKREIEIMKQNQLKQQAFRAQQQAIQAQQKMKTQADMNHRQQIAINQLHQSNINNESEISLLRARIHELENENIKLRDENIKLRDENQKLKQLIEKE